jgi:hypothetical protein
MWYCQCFFQLYLMLCCYAIFLCIFLGSSAKRNKLSAVALIPRYSVIVLVPMFGKLQPLRKHADGTDVCCACVCVGWGGVGCVVASKKREHESHPTTLHTTHSSELIAVVATILAHGWNSIVIAMKVCKIAEYII